MMQANAKICTSSDIMQLSKIPVKTLYRKLLGVPHSSMISDGCEIRGYLLKHLPENISRAVIPAEMDAQSETALEVAAKMFPEAQVPLKAWQREIRDARLVELECINRMAPLWAA